MSDNFPLSDIASMPVGMDEPDMSDARLEFYIRAARAPNTRRAYATDLQHFNAWGGHIPATAQEVAQYLSDHAGKLAISTLRRRVAALAWAHRECEAEDPTKAVLVRKVVRGIERHHVGWQRQARPLLVEDLSAICLRIGGSMHDTRDHALLTVGFFSGLRGSELLALQLAHVRVEKDRAHLFVQRGKTDQTGRGRVIVVPKLNMPFCPVARLKAWMDCGNEDSEWLFPGRSRTSDRRPLSTRQLSRIIQSRATSAGLAPEGLSSHSLRAGLVTSAALRELDLPTIAQQTGHRSLSAMSRYVRPRTEDIIRLIAQRSAQCPPASVVASDPNEMPKNPARLGD